jgi:hypothetical protein
MGFPHLANLRLITKNSPDAQFCAVVLNAFDFVALLMHALPAITIPGFWILRAWISTALIGEGCWIRL